MRGYPGNRLFEVIIHLVGGSSSFFAEVTITPSRKVISRMAFLYSALSEIISAMMSNAPKWLLSVLFTPSLRQHRERPLQIYRLFSGFGHILPPPAIQGLFPGRWTHGSAFSVKGLYVFYLLEGFSPVQCFVYLPGQVALLPDEAPDFPGAVPGSSGMSGQTAP